MKNKLNILTAAVLMLGLLPLTSIFAQQATSTATSTVPVSDSIAALQLKIKELEEQIRSYQLKIQELKSQIKIAKTELRNLTRPLHLKDSGDDVEELQRFLKEYHPNLYFGPITGYFGPGTRGAIKKFQKMHGMSDDGVVGSETISKFKELFEKGAGKSGKVPPGLLKVSGYILPYGIAKKLGLATSTPPIATSTDTTAPIISSLTAASTTATSVKITWATNEAANSKLWYSTSTPVVVSATPALSDSAMVISHELILSGLNSSSTYYYAAGSSDASGNTATSTEQSFTTLAQ